MTPNRIHSDLAEHALNGVIGGECAARIDVSFDLDRRMSNTVGLTKITADGHQEIIAWVALWHDEMRGQRRLAGAHGPDMKIVKGSDLRQGLQIIADVMHLDGGGGGAEREFETLAQKIPCSDDDNDIDGEAHQWIEPEPASQKDQ